MREKMRRGFAAMEPSQRTAIASKGGHAAHAKGTARRWTTAEATAAGRRGGQVTAARRAARRRTDDIETEID